jgi:hypothetical protein
MLKITAYYCIIIQNDFTASAKTAIALSTVENGETPAKLLCSPGEVMVGAREIQLESI